MMALSRRAFVAGTLALPGAKPLPAIADADGNFWRDSDALTRIAISLGLLYGMNAGVFNVFVAFTKSDVDVSCLGSPLANSMLQCLDRTGDITAGQFRDGIDTFYGDFRNRRVSLSKAAQIVVAQINGDSESEIQKLIQSARQQA